MLGRPLETTCLGLWGPVSWCGHPLSLISIWQIATMNLRWGHVQQQVGYHDAIRILAPALPSAALVFTSFRLVCHTLWVMGIPVFGIWCLHGLPESWWYKLQKKNYGGPKNIHLDGAQASSNPSIFYFYVKCWTGIWLFCKGFLQAWFPKKHLNGAVQFYLRSWFLGSTTLRKPQCKCKSFLVGICFPMTPFWIQGQGELQKGGTSGLKETVHFYVWKRPTELLDVSPTCWSSILPRTSFTSWRTH